MTDNGTKLLMHPWVSGSWQVQLGESHRLVPFSIGGLDRVCIHHPMEDSDLPDEGRLVDDEGG